MVGQTEFAQAAEDAHEHILAADDLDESLPLLGSSRIGIAEMINHADNHSRFERV